MNDRRGDGATPAHARAARPRGAGPLATAAAGVALAALLFAACGSPTPPTAVPTAGPSSGATASPPAAATGQPPTLTPSTVSPTTAASTTSSAPACEPADLKASHGIVEGGAGSVMTEVVLVSNSACSIDAFPALGLRDANGGALVGGAAIGPGRIDLAAGGAYRSQVRLANWCADEPAFPLALEIRIGEAEVPVTGDSFPESGQLPPCNGDTGPILEGTAWEAAS